MLALNAEFEACRRNSSSCWSSRIISAKDFFKGNHVTDLKEDELLTEIRMYTGGSFGSKLFLGKVIALAWVAQAQARVETSGYSLKEQR